MVLSIKAIAPPALGQKRTLVVKTPACFGGRVDWAERGEPEAHLLWAYEHAARNDRTIREATLGRIFNGLVRHMDHQGGAFKVKGSIWPRLYVATQENRAAKIDSVTKTCPRNMPLADNVCIRPVYEMGMLLDR